MKKGILLLVLFCAAILSGNAQDIKKVFGSASIVWYGLDFTKAKMLGFGDESPHQIRDDYFKVWSAATITDVDVAKTFQKTALYKDLAFLNKQNAERETNDLNNGKEEEFDAPAIAARISEIPIGQKKDGLGLAMIVQSFNKASEAGATVYVVFFDIATHNVLLTKKMNAKPTGGNTKAGWTGAIKSIFEKIEKKEFAAWRKEANY
jgi:hypothetical protein